MKIKIVNSAATKKLAAVIFLFLINGAVFGQHNDITITNPWSRALPEVTKTGATYISLTNHGKKIICLIGATTPIAQKVEIHGQTNDAGMMVMHKIESVELIPHRMVEFKPGEKHFMLLGLNKPLIQGTTFPMTLNFDKSPPITINVKILEKDWQTDKNDHNSHDHSSHSSTDH